MKKPVVIVGFMGTGKTTAGRELAGRLGLPFFDTDEIIEKEEGKTVAEIFDSRGEDYFRRREDEVLKMLLDKGPAVISTGGGTFENPELRRLCKEKAITIWLAARLEHLLGGIEQLRKGRPKLKLRTIEEMKQLYEKRSGDYADSDIAVEVENMSSALVAEEILQLLKKREYGIEEAARQYFETTLYGEPITTPEAIFEEVIGRRPTAEESRMMWQRINELLKMRKE